MTRSLTGAGLQGFGNTVETILIPLGAIVVQIRI